MKGLYILSSKLLDRDNVLKFGMSECLENRIITYNSVFKDPYYLACYVLDSDHNKSEIMTIETHIFNITYQYETEYYGSEYRQIKFETLHSIINEVLTKYYIKFEYHDKPKWKTLPNKKQILNEGNIINRYANTFNNPTTHNLKQNNKILNTEHMLRDYQKECIDLINNNGNIIVSLPTGTGKSIIMLSSLKNDLKYLILVPRIILMTQLNNEIIKFFPEMINNIQLIGNNNNIFDETKNITICVYNSISIIDKYCSSFTKIYIDEAHHIHNVNNYEIVDDLCDNKKYTQIIKNLEKYNNNVYLSATIHKKEGFYYYGKDIKYMIEHKYICDFILKVPILANDPNNKNICQYLITNYKNIIVYCNTRKEGKQINDILNKIQPNSSAYIDCYTSQTIKNKIIKNYENGTLLFIINVKILVEGFNAPITKGICLLHLPLSPIILLQIIGRALRLHLLKTLAYIILPYSTSTDESIMQEFLKIMNISGKNIIKSCHKMNNRTKLPEKLEDNTIQVDQINDNIDFNCELSYNSNGILLDSSEINLTSPYI